MSALGVYLKQLFAPHTVGMTEETPKASFKALGLMVVLLVLQVVARYKFDVLRDKEWQLVHILIGWTSCLLVVLGFHGLSALKWFKGKTLAVLLIGLLGVTTFWYLGRSDSYHRFFGAPELDYQTLGPIQSSMYFSVSGVVTRILIPFALLWVFYRQSPRMLGMTRPFQHQPGAMPHLGWIYVVLGLVMIPFLLYASGLGSFQDKYPLSRTLVAPDNTVWLTHLLVYQLFYFFVFFSGEFFWRGFFVFGFERGLGLYALAFMTVPYVTVHFGKPFPETLGAIVTGYVLGFLALKHRSAWGGVLLHYYIALSMDLLALYQRGVTVFSSYGVSP